MADQPALTDLAIATFAAGVFARPDPWVVEAYSTPGQPARVFASPEALADYARLRLSAPRGAAQFFVVYPDMAGTPVRRQVGVHPQGQSDSPVRDTWDGWGLISVYLRGADGVVRSHVSANSEQRARAWVPTYPEWNAPDSWHWPAVESHTRRLQRLLKKFG